MTRRDWNRRTCAKHKHATFAPVGGSEEELVAERLQVQTSQGVAWRCLRCGDYVLGEPASSGAVAEAPEVLRGRALRDHFILRVLAVERLLRGLIIFVIAYGVWRFSAHQDAVRQLFEKDLTLLNPIAKHFGEDLDNATIVNRIRKTFTYTPKTLDIAAMALAAYALLESVEGIGLWLAKRWGEYLTVVGTSIFLPIEVWDGYNKIHEGKSWTLAAITFTINVAAVVYLLVTKRLFGIRGGGRAFEEAKHADSLLTVELAACGVVPQTLKEALGAPSRAPESPMEIAEVKAEAEALAVTEARDKGASATEPAGADGADEEAKSVTEETPAP